MKDGDEGANPPLPLATSSASSSGGGGGGAGGCDCGGSGDGGGTIRQPAPPVMTTISRHYFGQFSGNSTDASSSSAAAADDDHDDADDEPHAFSIDVIENMQEDYGMFVWPCSIVLAEYLWQQRLRFSSKSVIELGAGTSLPGLVAAKVGADVTLTDNSNRLEVLDNMRKTCNINRLNCKIMGLTWGEWNEPLFSLHPEIVLGADVLYDTTDFEDLFATVTFLLQNSPGSVFITTYDNRSGHHLIEYLMAKWGWKCTKLLDAFSFMPSCKTRSLQGNIQLVELELIHRQPECSTPSELRKGSLQ